MSLVVVDDGSVFGVVLFICLLYMIVVLQGDGVLELCKGDKHGRNH